jgi:hypothetical protein
VARGPLRIAVCFAGKAEGIATHHAPRELAKRGMKNIRGSESRVLDCLTGWESIRKHVYSTEKGHVYDTFFHAWIENEERKSELCSVLKPSAYVAEKQIEFNPHPYYQRVQSKMHSLVTSFDLAMKHAETTGKKYDFFVFLRYDLFFKNFVDYTSLHDNVLYHSGWKSHAHKVHNYFWVGSQSAIQDTLIPLAKECHEWCKSPYDRAEGGKKFSWKSPKPVSLHRFFQFYLGTLDQPPLHGPILNHTDDFHICRDLWWKEEPTVDSRGQVVIGAHGVKPTSPFENLKYTETTWEMLVSEFSYYE